MKYRLYENAVNDTSNVIKEVLKNRGINDWKTYLDLDERVLIPYANLQNINKAVEIFLNAIENRNPISILVDSDPDGFCSTAMMYLYIKRLDANYPVHYIMHKKAKTHGLGDDIEIPEDTKLLIIPDAGTNDVEECKLLVEKGIQIIILDHHEQERENPWAIIVNNQISNKYSNKDLCGAGVVYKFLQAVDSENWNEYADDYLDLCALANISDVMDMRSLETRYLTNVGLENVKNKCFQALIQAQEYSMNGEINIYNIQWSITPILNGMIRIGSYEEKELLFRAFIEQEEHFEYKKRATKDKPAEIIQESIFDRAARLCKNAKSRQDKMREKSTELISEMVKIESSENKVIIEDVTEVLDNGLTGVVAIKIAERFNKPCILLKKHKTNDSKVKVGIKNDEKNNKSYILIKKDEVNNDKIVYGGSGRNIDNSPIENFKDIVNSTGVINAQGHANAFGIVDMPIEDKENAIHALNDRLKNVIYDSTYNVDFILSYHEITIPFIYQFEIFKKISAQGIGDPLIAIENICIGRNEIDVFGKNEDTISFIINDIKYIQFKCKEGMLLYDWVQNAWDDEECVTLNLVGKPSINEYNGIRTPQIIIEDVNIIQTNSNDNSDW